MGRELGGSAPWQVGVGKGLPAPAPQREQQKRRRARRCRQLHAAHRAEGCGQDMPSHAELCHAMLRCAEVC